MRGHSRRGLPQHGLHLSSAVRATGLRQTRHFRPRSPRLTQRSSGLAALAAERSPLGITPVRSQAGSLSMTSSGSRYGRDIRMARIAGKREAVQPIRGSTRPASLLRTLPRKPNYQATRPPYAPTQTAIRAS